MLFFFFNISLIIYYIYECFAYVTHYFSYFRAIPFFRLENVNESESLLAEEETQETDNTPVV